MVYNELLRTLRLTNGNTQQNIADMLGINRSTYTCYETGKTRPDLEFIAYLSKLYDVSVEIFFDNHFNLELMENRRPKKKIVQDIEEITGLTPDERTIIAIVRTRKDIITKDLLSKLKNEH